MCGRACAFWARCEAFRARFATSSGLGMVASSERTPLSPAARKNRPGGSGRREARFRKDASAATSSSHCAVIQPLDPTLPRLPRTACSRFLVAEVSVRSRGARMRAGGGGRMLGQDQDFEQAAHAREDRARRHGVPRRRETNAHGIDLQRPRTRPRRSAGSSVAGGSRYGDPARAQSRLVDPESAQEACKCCRRALRPRASAARPSRSILPRASRASSFQQELVFTGAPGAANSTADDQLGGASRPVRKGIERPPCGRGCG
jgi:hypothetical protein